MSIDYKSYDFQVYEYLLRLQQELKHSVRCPQTEKWLRRVMDEQDRIKTRRFRVAVVGEFKRGKSSFVNALLGRKVLPVDASPTTAVISRITYGDTPKAQVHYKDGRKEQVEIDRLSDYVTKLTSKSKENAAKVKEAVIEYPSVFCQNYVDLIDTPGINDEESMNAVTLSELDWIDLAIVAVSVNYPFDETECDFVVQLLENSGISQIVVVVTYIDTVCESDRGRALENINTRIKENVLERLKKLYPRGEPIFEKYDRIFTNLQQYAVSSVDALRAYETSDHELLEKSGLAELNKELPYLILSSQNKIILQKAMTTTARITKEYQEGSDLIAKSCEEHVKAMGRFVDSLHRKYGKYDKSIAAPVKVSIFRCLERFRKDMESKALDSFMRWFSAEQKSGAPIQQKEIFRQCERICGRIDMEIKSNLNIELEEVYQDETSKAASGLCKELSTALDSFSGYFRKQQEELARFSQHWTAPLMGESAASFVMTDADMIEAIYKRCATAHCDTADIMKKFDNMLSESLNSYCKSRKKELEALCDAAFISIYKIFGKITVDLGGQIRRYQTAAADSVEKMRQDKALRQRLTQLYDKNAALQRQFMQELGKE